MKKRIGVIIVILLFSSFNKIQMTSGAVAPDLISPAYGEYIHDITPTFEWGLGVGISYTIQVATDDTFSSLVINENVGLLFTYTVPLANELNYDTYYWRVGANDKGGTDWSTVFELRIVHLPSTPILLTPSDSDIRRFNTPYFSWTVSNEEISRWQISKHADFSVVEDSVNTGLRHYTPPPLLDGLYYWRIVAVSYAGVEVYSDIWSFMIDTVPPDATQLVFPYEFHRSNTNNIRFEWTVVDEVDYYQLIIDDSLYFTSPLFSVNTNDFFYNLVIPDGEYFWKVNTFDYAGNFQYSEINYFVIDTIVPAAELISPLNNTLKDNRDVYFVWLGESDHYRYHFAYRFYGEMEVDYWLLTESHLHIPFLNDGLIFWSISVEDIAYNVNISDTWCLKIDTEDPFLVNAPDDTNIEEGIPGNFLEFIFTDATLESFTIYCNNIVLSQDNYSITYDYVPALHWDLWKIMTVNMTLDHLDSGEYNYTIVIMDTCGHSAVHTVIVTVIEVISEISYYNIIFTNLVGALTILLYLTKRKKRVG